MAVTYNDKAGRQKILEGLWLIGIEPGQLNVSADLEGAAFLDSLHRNGVDDNFIGRAMAGVEWRAPGGSAPLSQKLADLLRVSGYRQDEVERFLSDAQHYGGTGVSGEDPKSILSVLTNIFGDRSAGAMLYKATGGKATTGALWNPFRTDVPPKGVDTTFGSMGTITVPGPVNELPQGPTLIQQKQQAAAAPPGAPTITGRTSGAPGAPGAGRPGPGAPGTPPPVKLTPEQIRADIETRYGWAAAFMDIPEVANILNLAANGTINAEEANRRWLSTDYYRSTSVNQRNWRILEKTGPGEAAAQLEDQVTSIKSKAQTLGVTIDEGRIRQIAKMSKEFGWSDQMINASLASEVKWDPSGAKTGVMAQIKASQQSQLVPLSDQSMTQWAQAIVSGAKTQSDFDAYLKDQAKSLFPTMANYLDTTPGGTVKQYLDPYAQTISQTLGMPAGDINWMDPKWFRFVNASDPKTGQRGMVDIADVQRTIISDGQYGYDQTNNGKQAKAGLAKTILQDWGFIAPGTNSGGFG